MVETFVLFASTWFITWQVLVAFCIFGVWSEHCESRGFAVFWALAAAVLGFFYFKMPLIQVAMYAGAYLVVGIVWSFYRYKRFIVAKIESMKEMNHRMDRISNYHPSNMLNAIAAWIIIWPFSLIENLCGDIINGIETLVKKVFKGVYNRIYENAVKQINVTE